MYNAITSTDIKTLALNRDLLRDHNDYFSNKITVKKISNQKSTGRCWLFAALNAIRPEIVKKNKLKDFEFSHIYLTFWEKMEKANLFYERMIEYRDRDMMDRELVFILQYPIGDGGYWENAKDLIQKYGVVPKEVMPETHSSDNTGRMNQVMDKKMRVDAVKLRKMAANGKSVKQMRKAKEKMLSEIYRMLVMNLGQPPETFDWRYEPKDKKKDHDEDDEDDDDDDDDEDEDDDDEDEPYEDKSIIITGYTPKRFYDEFVSVDLDEYVNIFNDAAHPLSKRYQVVLTRSSSDGHDLDYANVCLETLKSIAIKSLRDGTPLWFAVDVGPDQYRDKGVMKKDLYDYQTLFGVDLEMTRAQLALFRQNTPNHGMNLIGVDIQNEKPVKWLVENSWGDKSGNKGFWTMYDDWFDINIYCVIAKKEYVPEEVLKIFEQDPTLLPVWDPMW
jgi:bleomycin hydrolase